MSYGVGCRCGLDPLLLWLWCRLAATASIQPLAWEPPYAGNSSPEKKKGRKEKKEIFPFHLDLIIYCFIAFNMQEFIYLFIFHFRGKPMAYGSSHARGQIGAIATGLHHSHSITRSELHL